MNRRQNYSDYGMVPPTSFGLRTLVGPYIDEPIVSGLDRCLRFFGVKVCKPKCNDQDLCSKPEKKKTLVCVNEDCVLTVGNDSDTCIPRRLCQGTSTSSLHSEESVPHFSNIQDSITYLKSCLKKGNSDQDCRKKISKSVNILSNPTEIPFKALLNMDLDDVPEIPQCSSPRKLIAESCEINLNEPKVDPRFCTTKDPSSPLQIVPSEKNFSVFVKDSMPFLPQCSFTSCPVSTECKSDSVDEDDSAESLIPTTNTRSPPKVSINPDVYIPEQDKYTRGYSSMKRKPMLSPIMSVEDLNIPERDNYTRSMVDSEDSFQRICPLFENECYTKSNADLAIIPICHEIKSCCNVPMPKSRTDICTQSDCVAQKDAYTEPDNFAMLSNSLSQMLQSNKNSRNEPIDFSKLNIPPNFLPTNRRGFSNPSLQMPFNMSPDRIACHSHDNSPQCSSRATSGGRKKSNRKKSDNSSMPTGVNCHCGCPPSQITATQWAVCRINTYSNLSKTYQIMQTELKLPAVDDSKTIMFFLLLPNGAAMSYVPASDPDEC